MVKATTIRQCNAHFASEHHEGLVCVFAGATSGIGAGTLERIALMLDAPTFYVLGRSAARFAGQCAKLESLNPSCKVMFLEVEVSLLSNVDAACKQITAAEKKVDYLYMSPGLIPLNGPQCTCPQALNFSNADRPHRHERGPRNALRDFILLKDAAHVESSATSSSVTAAASSERAQRRQGEAHA